MIVYDTKNWATTIQKIYLSFNRAFTTRVLFKYIFNVIIYTTFVVVLDQLFTKNFFQINPLFFSLLGVILSLMLVFRLNSSYDKWWEGRKAWGSLINISRMIAAQLNSLLPKDDYATRKYFAVQIANYAMSLQGHLRDNVKWEELEPLDNQYFEDLKLFKHTPNKIVTMMLEAVEQKVQNGDFSEFDKLYLKPQIASLLDILGICERIKNTPIPFSHNSYIKTFILTYVFALPFGIVNTLGYYTIPTVALVAYALIGVEVISEEVEDPFGREANDLPMIHMSNVIKESVFEILGAKSEKVVPSVEVDNKFIQIIY
jgi:ion channel-forming bestrophin family protein